jgi:sarcosine oxidase, subunit gamma
MLSRVLEPCSIIRVQTWDSNVRGVPKPAGLAKAEQALGVTWPEVIGVTANGRTDILCIGPTDWLVIAPDPDVTGLLHGLGEAFEGSSFRATNVSAALSWLAIEDPDARVLLNKGTALDLDPTCFPPGRCARTRFADIPLIVRCMRVSAFELIVASSYHEYLIAWLNDAAGEFQALTT